MNTLPLIKRDLIRQRNKILDTWRYIFPWYKARLEVIDSLLDLVEHLERE